MQYNIHAGEGLQKLTGVPGLEVQYGVLIRCVGGTFRLP